MTPKQQLDSFLKKYDPKIAGIARRALAKMRKLVPGATEIVYDNYNALVIGRTEREGVVGDFFDCSVPTLGEPVFPAGRKVE